MNSLISDKRQDQEWQMSSLLNRLHIDGLLMLGLLLLLGVGLMMLYSAGGQDMGLIFKQLVRMSMALMVMLVIAQINPDRMRDSAYWLYGLGLVLLIAVLLFGHEGKGAQRWLDLGFFRFQPSEIIKLAVPILVAAFLAERSLPPSALRLIASLIIIAVPAFLIAKQPDLGTAVLIASSGLVVIFLSGISWRIILGFLGLCASAAPVLWFFMHDYQRRRVLTFLNPESDPLGAGYHIIQSKIAIGSGGTFGQGWLQGTQSHLEFLPERSTDFIFSVIAEEFGLVGVAMLLLLYLLIAGRGLYIAGQAQSSFARLLAGSISITFLVYVFVNVGMVTGLLPVVGVPLPLISYGGTSMVTLLAGFGILMSIHTHRRMMSP
ncbi:rod shape-determining protein RodA [Methylophaga sp. OBS4]|uniref:rod shape-determining protein RodA n=1 Tax=Methylophaga sp. OBS4 TaxID=2991935 RepID=UPI00225ACB14|nr:rod shape-determining protein RodA [Methylophaga sp. OBS4]MCX4188379.1 rod shape-determining protein RodA [Methylophaga sp. OBS4]